MKFDIYESFLDGSKERKLTKTQIKELLTYDELKKMTSLFAEVIEKGNLKYWAEEAMIYSRGIEIA